MTVEVFSDVVCPFCYIGKRHLETALAEMGLADAEVRYRSFELDPHLADSDLGSPSTLHLAAKKGLSVADAERMTQAVAYRASQVGIPMDFTKAKVLRTRDAHRLLQWARTQSLEQAANLKEELMKDYFCGGVNLNEPDALADAAERAGLDRRSALELLGNPEAFLAEVEADLAYAQRLNVRGVPFFVFNQRVGLSGAQSVETFKSAMKESLQLPTE
ncbi:MAG: DsbA family oxidoreductase [Bacteroidetes bacterium]|nr:DsbA family oxidoreductase [Bacteroidota bacterium]